MAVDVKRYTRNDTMNVGAAEKRARARHRKLRLAAAAALPVLSGLMGRAAHAASGTWLDTGATSANWSDTTNWASGTIPGATTGTTDTSIATFNSAVGSEGLSTTPIVIDSGRNAAGISFDTAAGSYFIGATGGNSLLLTSGGSIQILSTLTATNAVETINAPLVIEGAAGTDTFANNSANGTGAARARWISAAKSTAARRAQRS